MGLAVLAGRDARDCDALDIDWLLARLSDVPAENPKRGPLIFEILERFGHDVRGTTLYLERLREQGETQLRAPLPTVDPRVSSQAQLLALATQMYQRALVAYRELVDRWMSTLSSQMEHRVLLPARVVGYVDYGRIVGYFEPLADGSTDEVVMHPASDRVAVRGRPHHARQRAARPHAARWLPGSFGRMPFNWPGRYPVADIVYRWIGEDLHRLGLVSHVPENRNDTIAASPWQAVPALYLG